MYTRCRCCNQKNYELNIFFVGGKVGIDYCWTCIIKYDMA